MINFALEAKDRETAARAGRLSTPHGEVPTPVFMPVGTHAAVRALTPEQLRQTGARIVLANTYHLALRPGPEVVRKAGGLHGFMAWPGPILSDSGGYQVFSLPRKEISAEGVCFASELDGKKILLTPELAIELQHALGADIIMPLDECTPHPATRKLAARGVSHSLAWLERCIAAHGDGAQALFGIVQGSVYPDLRRSCAEAMVKLDLPGYAIGGVSVGEGLELLKRIVAATAPQLPSERPRYLMGVGLPEDLLESIALGMDMFDCVIPTRFARSATLFTRRGRIRMTHRRYRRDFYPIEPGCACYACGDFTRAYLHHLYRSNEILGTILGAIHNVSFYQTLMTQAREAILAGRFVHFKTAFLSEYGAPGAAVPD
ncbi:MAG: tRNA guanosine(34) transglycosylase Tgt [Deltaproteobacteria bacterium]|nr:tRNA guanosine(34) transglycosylase Tgt [Deltaproteobacteria bacterium]